MPTHNTRANLRARQGWVSGTGGGISVKAADGRIVMAPSGVQKERMRAEDMFVLDAKGDVLEAPAARPPPYPAPKLSECSPLFMAVRLRVGEAAGRERGGEQCSLAPLEGKADALQGGRRKQSARAAPYLCCPHAHLTLSLAPSPPPSSPRPPPNNQQAYELRGAGAVLHSHSLSSVLATMLDESATEFRVTHLEMIKVRR